LLLKSRDSRAIFLRLYPQIRKKTPHFQGSGSGKNGNFNTIYQGLGIFKRNVLQYTLLEAVRGFLSTTT